MSTLTSHGPATLYLNGQAIGTADVTLPTRPLPEPLPLSVTQLVDIILHYPPGKKGRRQRQQLCSLAWPVAVQRALRHYRAVKRHQLRKRLLKKQA